MSKTFSIGPHTLGPSAPSFIIAEIGINHNGSVETAKALIDAAVTAGCQAVKFQKRTVEVVYTAEELAKPRENPFGDTNGDLKRGLEFGQSEFSEIDTYCKEKGILWFASCWDEGSVDFIDAFAPPCYKIASASLTDDELLKKHVATGRPVILSTGMSTMEEIEHALEILAPVPTAILHCTSTYPTASDELNLSLITVWDEKFTDTVIGFSGHDVGLVTSSVAVALGARIVERHITLDRSMWGSDQSASVEPQGFAKLVSQIRHVETAMGDGVKKVYDSEVPIKKKLRRVG
ncbi:MAG: N-acetylneuraminate synthase family protein [Opitutales bacterium]